MGKLEEAWTGPWTVVKKCGPVTYKLKPVQGKGRGKVVHLNTIKEYNERHQRVGRLTVLMEDKEDERLAVELEKKVVGQGTCEGFSQKDVDKILQEFGNILDPEPGLTDWVQMRIDTGDSNPYTNILIDPQILY